MITHLTTSTYGRPVREVAQELNKDPATLHRWRLRGCIDSDRVRRHCYMTKVGHEWHVRDEDLAAFFAALGGNRSAPETRAERARDSERVARELNAAGI
jgi:hypothetical protein